LSGSSNVEDAWPAFEEYRRLYGNRVRIDGRLDSGCRGAAADQVLKRSVCCSLGAECTPPLSKTEGPGPEWGIAKVPARFSCRFCTRIIGLRICQRASVLRGLGLRQ